MSTATVFTTLQSCSSQATDSAVLLPERFRVDLRLRRQLALRSPTERRHYIGMPASGQPAAPYKTTAPGGVASTGRNPVAGEGSWRAWRTRIWPELEFFWGNAADRSPCRVAGPRHGCGLPDAANWPASRCRVQRRAGGTKTRPATW